MATEKKPNVARLRLTLFPRAETAVRSGHPWVYNESIKTQNREGETGEMAVIYDKRDRFMAVGLYETESPIRVRILHCGKPANIDREWWLETAKACLAKRAGSIIDAGTNGARMINGESEGFPGIVADRYAHTLVVKVYAASWFARWDEIEEVLREVFQPEYLVLRMSRNVAAIAKQYGLEEGFRGAPGDETVVFLENGIHFEAAVIKGQKTGFFLDQRDNRARVEKLANGRKVLNVFSFSGGFSLYAARGGASSVTDIDISTHALESAERNMALNADDEGIAKAKHQGLQADAFRWMDENQESFDLIITDPPTLAKREAEKEGALRAYRHLNRAAISRLNPGGILLAASCSAHVTQQDLFDILEELAHQSGRPYKELWRSDHAADHPATFREAKYLKAICLEFG